MDICIGTYVSVKYLLETLKAKGASEEEFDNIELELDYGGCYYESDTPSIKAVWNKKK